MTLVSARSFKETALELTDNVVYGMKNAAKSFPKMSTRDKNSAISAITAVRNEFPAVCVKVLHESVAMMAESGSSNPKMQKLNTAYKAIKLMDLGYLNLTVFAMHPDLAKNAMKASMGKRDLNDMMTSLDKRAWGNKSPQALDQISKVEMEVMQAGLKVLESDDTLDLVMEAF